jgi:hypothetical protein
VGKPEGIRSLEKPTHRLDDNIKVALREVELGHGLDRMAQDKGQVAGCCECGKELLGSIKCGEFPD